MFKKIYKELILIREELQAIRSSLEPVIKAKLVLDRIGIVNEYERKYINQAYARVVVSFELPSSDWCLLKTSSEWCRIEECLGEIRNKYQKEKR